MISGFRINNDREAIRQILKVQNEDVEVIGDPKCYKVPNDLLNGEKYKKLISAGFKITEIGTAYTYIQ